MGIKDVLRNSSAIDYAQNNLTYHEKVAGLSGFRDSRDEVEPTMGLLQKRAFLDGLRKYKEFLCSYIEEYALENKTEDFNK